MISYHVSLSDGLPSPGNPGANHDEFIRKPSFLDLVSKERKAELSKLGEDNPLLLADICAAAIAKAYSEFGGPYDIIGKALQTCHRILEQAGYAFESDSAEESLQGRPRAVILCPGCQLVNKLMRTRVDLSYMLTTRIRTIAPIVVFSGMNPMEKASVRERDESALMEHLFRKKLSKGKKLNSEPTLVRENKSATTQQNIDNFFERPEIKKIRKMRLFVTSNTFHLIRLSEIVHCKLMKDNGKLLQKVTSLTLIGAEDPFNPPSWTKNDKYIRALLYEVFQFLLKHHRELVLSVQ